MRLRIFAQQYLLSRKRIGAFQDVCNSYLIEPALKADGLIGLDCESQYPRCTCSSCQWCTESRLVLLHCFQLMEAEILTSIRACACMQFMLLVFSWKLEDGQCCT